MCVLTWKYTTQWDSQIPALYIFVDLSKTFDLSCPGNLFKILQLIGIWGNAFTLLKSFLWNRFDVTISEMRNLTIGVSQGTVLGSIRFNLYINSLLSIDIMGFLLSFAEDTTIFYQSEIWNSLKVTVQTNFEAIRC